MGAILSLLDGCCSNDTRNDANKLPMTLERLPPAKKVRPLLCDLEEYFMEYAGADAQLDHDELCMIWEKCALKKVGKLNDDDKALIRQSVKVFFHEIDVDKSGKLTYHEFAAFMMGVADNKGPLQDMRKHLNKALKEDPTRMSKLIEQFKAWDKNGDGFVTPEELDSHLQDLQTEASADGKITKSEAEGLATITKMKDEIFKHADVDGDGKVDLWEVMAYMLGRKKQPVELLLYDISKGAAAKLGPLLLGKKIEAVHSGVVVFESEYWYGGKVFRSNPPCEKAFGMPLTDPWGIHLVKSEVREDLPVVRLGYTFVTHEEFVTWLTTNVSERYTGIEKYDLLTHSCNHFSNEIVTFLTGQGIPDKIFELQKSFLSGPVIAIRPFLNRHLGGFADAEKELDHNLFAKDSTDIGGDADSVAKSLGEGDVVIVEGVEGISGVVIATILHEADGKCEIKYYDPDSHHITTKTGVPKGKCKSTSSIHQSV
mmetsp:Transcript_57249/g.92737  ORF Transcript_57249/g.92737 Transcript_57249/m.92737 type:complete len:484 (-) Transcript_57249:51-1502(-)